MEAGTPAKLVPPARSSAALLTGTTRVAAFISLSSHRTANITTGCQDSAVGIHGCATPTPWRRALLCLCIASARSPEGSRYLLQMSPPDLSGSAAIAGSNKRAANVSTGKIGVTSKGRDEQMFRCGASLTSALTCFRRYCLCNEPTPPIPLSNKAGRSPLSAR